MTDRPFHDAASLRLHPGRLSAVDSLFRRWVDSGEIPAASYAIGRGPLIGEPRYFGVSRPGAGGRAVDARTLFLVASLTKPLTVAAVMRLIEQGLLTLDDRLADIVDGFSDGSRSEIRIRHLMTHTSGLPDMLPENDRLRAAHASADDFVAAIKQTPLLFPAGKFVRYQSMGTMMLAEVVRVTSGHRLPQFLEAEFFRPLGMNDTWLGIHPDQQDRLAQLRIGEDQARTDWHWNSPYWLGFGAPWGGLITTAADYARFCRAMLPGQPPDPARPLSPRSIAAMARNQLLTMSEIPDQDRLHRPWGLGWRLNWPGSSAHFGDLLGPAAFGHWGATGTLCWIDPESGVYAVIFTTLPQGEQGAYLARASNAIASAVL